MWRIPGDDNDRTRTLKTKTLVFVPRQRLRALFTFHMTALSGVMLRRQQKVQTYPVFSFVCFVSLSLSWYVHVCICMYVSPTLSLQIYLHMWFDAMFRSRPGYNSDPSPS